MTRGRALRRLVLGDDVYLWRVHHRHRVVELPGRELPGCAEVFTAYREGWRRAPLRVLFADGERQGREPIERSGIVVAHDDPAAWANLHQPATARRLIELALARGWQPAADARPFVLDDGFALLRLPDP